MITHRDLMVGMVNTYLQGFPELENGPHRIVTHLPLAHLVERSMSLCLMLIADVDAAYRRGGRQPARDAGRGGADLLPRCAARLGKDRVADPGQHRPRRSFQAHELSRCDGDRPNGTREIPVGPQTAAARGSVRLYGLARTARLQADADEGRAAQARARHSRPARQSHRPCRRLGRSGASTCATSTASPSTRWCCASAIRSRSPAMPAFRFTRRRSRSRPTEKSWCAAPACSPATGRTKKPPSRPFSDGWFHTGDVAGTMANGHFRIVDRKKDIMVTSGGKNIAPSEIENLLKGSPYISEAILFADGRKFPSALIEIDFDTVSDWARQHGVVYTGFTSLAQHPRVVELIGAGDREGQHRSSPASSRSRNSGSFRRSSIPRKATRRRRARSSASTSIRCSRTWSKTCTGTIKRARTKRRRKQSGKLATS